MTEQALDVESLVTTAEPFNVDTLDNIDFLGNGRIVIDSKRLTELNLQDILKQNEILLPSDSPKRIIMFADKTEKERRIGIMADMGNNDNAGLYLAKGIPATDEEDLSFFTITRIEPLRNRNNKYNHSEMRSGNLIEDANLSSIFAQLTDVLILSEDEN